MSAFVRTEGVGLTYVRIRVSKDIGGTAIAARVLVDTGASYTMLRRDLLSRLSIVPRERRRVRLGDGRVVERETGIAHVWYRGRVTPTWVLFGESGDASLLGVVTLEELSLRVNPKSRTLEEVDVHPMVRAVDASSLP